jgi:hypothetical protein
MDGEKARKGGKGGQNREVRESTPSLKVSFLDLNQDVSIPT